MPLANLNYWTVSCPSWRPPITECFCSVRWPPSWPSWRIIFLTVTSSICVWMVSNQCVPSLMFSCPLGTQLWGFPICGPPFSVLMSVITQIGCPFSFINMCLLLDLSSRNYEVWGSCRAFKEIQWWRLTVFHLSAEHQGRRSGPQLASCRHRCDLWQRLEPPPGLCESLLWLERSIASLQLSSDLSFLTSKHLVVGLHD